MFVFAHFSDPHLSPMPFPAPWMLFNKRFFGAISWYARKKPIHQTAALAALVDDIHSAAPDHIVVTGDLTNIALPAEFARARRWLDHLGPSRRVSVIPGNHDAYVRTEWNRSRGLWADFMTGVHDDGGLDGAELPPACDADFPFVRRRGPLALIGLSSAAPMPLLGTPAAGRLGKNQLERLRQHLGRLADQKLFRVVLIHHPPYPGVSPRKGLFDARELCGVLREAGAELVLYGHLHEPGFFELATPSGTIPMIGLPSASARSRKGSSAARYHLCRLSGGPGKWEVDVEVREVEPTLDRFCTKERFQLRSGRGSSASAMTAATVETSVHNVAARPGAISAGPGMR